jgi:hypothetical protein
MEHLLFFLLSLLRGEVVEDMKHLYQQLPDFLVDQVGVVEDFPLVVLEILHQYHHHKEILEVVEMELLEVAEAAPVEQEIILQPHHFQPQEVPVELDLHHQFQVSPFFMLEVGEVELNLQELSVLVEMGEELQDLMLVQIVLLFLELQILVGEEVEHLVDLSQLLLLPVLVVPVSSLSVIK